MEKERKVCRRIYSVSVPFRSLSVLDKKLEWFQIPLELLKGRTCSLWMGQTLKFIGTHGWSRCKNVLQRTHSFIYDLFFVVSQLPCLLIIISFLIMLPLLFMSTQLSNCKLKSWSPFLRSGLATNNFSSCFQSLTAQ